jgi:hypothetical protein
MHCALRVRSTSPSTPMKVREQRTTRASSSLHLYIVWCGLLRRLVLYCYCTCMRQVAVRAVPSLAWSIGAACPKNVRYGLNHFCGDPRVKRTERDAKGNYVVLGTAIINNNMPTHKALRPHPLTLGAVLAAHDTPS